MKKARFLLVIALISLSLVSCGGKQPPEAILIGGTMALTGYLAPDVGPMDKLTYAWAEMVNEGGGLYVKEYDRRIPIRFIIYDDESDPDKARELYERLVTEDQVHLLLGPVSSPLTFSASTVAEKHRIPMLCVEANSNAIYTRGFKWIVGILGSGLKWSHAYLELVEAKTDVKSVAFVVQENLHTKEVYEGTVSRAREMGFEVVLEESLTGPEPNIDDVVAKLKKLDPDLIFVSAFEPFAVSFVERLDEEGVRPRALHVIHHGGFLVESLGEQAEGITGEHFWMPGLPGEGQEEFEKLLQRTGFTAQAYRNAPTRMVAFQVLRAAIEEAGTLDREKLQATLKEIKVMTIGGQITFAPDGTGSMQPFPTQIQNGAHVTVWPGEAAAAKYIYPRRY